MQSTYENLSPEFQEFYYYLISDNKTAEFARHWSYEKKKCRKALRYLKKVR